MLPLIILGAGGHAKVIASIASAIGRRIFGVCDPKLAAIGIREWRGIPILGDDEVISKYSPKEYELALGIGIRPGLSPRISLFIEFTEKGYIFPALIHPCSVVDRSVIIEDGAQVMAGVVLQSDCTIGKNTIINTRACIDHDSKIGDHVHVAPGSVICGGVLIGDSTFVGASATILPSVKIGRHCLIAAGATLAKKLNDGERFFPHRKSHL